MSKKDRVTIRHMGKTYLINIGGEVQETAGTREQAESIAKKYRRQRYQLPKYLR
jgi:hypothetical protein